MLIKFFKDQSASISVFLALIILPMYTLAGLVVDGARISSSKVMVSSAGDLAMNAALSEYDQILKEVYGLFAMSKTPEDLNDNVGRYFSNTINNTSLLNESDGYTRQFLNSISSMFSDDEEISFDNILKMQVESIDALSVKDTSIAKPEIMKRQITDYMKYRGPISLGQGFLTKFSFFKDISKQNEAVKDKMEYEEDLDTIQKECNALFEKLESYRTNSQSAEADLKAMYDQLYAYYLEVSKYTAMYYSDEYKIPDLVNNYDETKGIKDQITEESDLDANKERDKNIVALEIIDLYLSDKIITKVEEAGTEQQRIERVQSPFTDEIDARYSVFYDASDLDTAIDYCRSTKENMDKYQLVRDMLVLYDKYFDKLDDEQKKEFQGYYDVYMPYEEKIEHIIKTAQDSREVWKSKLNENAKNAAQLVYDKYTYVNARLEELSSSKTHANEIINIINGLEEKKANWEQSVGNLSEGEIKTTMKSDFENKTEVAQTEDINGLITVLTQNESYFNHYKTEIEKINYADYILLQKNGVDASKNYESEITQALLDKGENLSIVNVDSLQGVNGTASNLMTVYFHCFKYDASVIKTEIDETIPYYKYLKSICSKATEIPTELEKESTEMKNDLEKKGKVDATEEVNLPESSQEAEGELDGEIMKAIEALSNAGTGEESFAKPDNDDDTTKKSKSMLSSIGDFLGSVSEISERLLNDGITNVYLTEYITEMFSYYTVDKQPDGDNVKDIVPTTLSGVELNAENNVFYKSEVEYILWGDSDVNQNVKNTAVLIFGIRFALNTIYAFTNSEIRTMTLSAATAIAGWTGFGVPIVQTLLILALAMAESVIDVQALLSGKAVVLYKNSSTWILSPTGLIDKLKDGAVNLASTAIDDAFAKINDLAMDKIDLAMNTVNDFVDDTVDGAVEALTNSIINPIQDKAISILRDTTGTVTEETIRQAMTITLEKVRADIQAEQDSPLKDAKIAGLDAFISGYIPTISTVIYEQYSNIAGSAEDKIQAAINEINTQVSKLVQNVKEPIQNAVSELGEGLKNDVSQIISEKGDDAKEAIMDKMNGYLDDMAGKATAGLGDLTVNKKDVTSITSALTFTYEEYLKLFVLIGTFTDTKEKAMLTNIAKLMQVNLTKGMENAQKYNVQINKSENFDITKAYTMVKLKAEVSIKTTFMNIPIPTSTVDEYGNTKYELDFSKMGTGKRSIKYASVNGY